MKFPKYSILSLVLLLSYCTTDSKKAESEANTQTAEAFVPNPIRIDKVDVKTLEIGAKAPDFNLPASDGQFYKLEDFSDAEVLCVLFTCNHCPTAQAYEDRVVQIDKDYKDKGVALVAISPNSDEALLHEECGYTDLRDGYAELALRAKDRGFNFPYLYDGDNHAVSLEYGPVATPHVFVFDKNRLLTYVGRLDKSEKPGSANAEDLRAALDATLAGNPVAEATTKTFGCSVKWSWKDEYTHKVNSEWAEKQVSLDPIDEKGIEDLLKNDSDKLRLVNVWATWCGPCILEYPDFITIHRMYAGRDFEFVSITADEMANKDKAQAFLQKSGSAVQNYIFNGKDKYSLIEAIDPAWNGALPYTVLVEPGGKVVYSTQGTIEPLALKKTIVEHPMIGRYY